MKPLMPTLWNDAFRPFLNHEVVPFDKRLDEIINKAFPDLSQITGVNWIGNEAYPRVDIIDYDDKVVIEADIHGLSKEDVNIEITENMLTIAGKKRENPSTNVGTYIKREIKRSSFRRAFELGEFILKDKISAKFENGQLFVTLPKQLQEKPEIKTKTIKIS